MNEWRSQRFLLLFCSFHTDVPPMMAAGIRALIYAGDCDFICNWLGNQAWTLQLQWPGQAGFNAAAFQPWNVNNQQAGNVRTYQTLTFATVANAGHMAPGGECSHK
jgi:cathepsin A (carboxypeptidase C)